MVDELGNEVTELSDLKTRFGEQDKVVDTSKDVVGTIPEEAWGKIQLTIKQLNDVLDSAPPPIKDQKYLSAATESKLTAAVYAAVAEVHKHVTDAHSRMQNEARNISGQNNFPLRPTNTVPVSNGSAPTNSAPMSFAGPSSQPARAAGPSRAMRGASGYDGTYTDKIDPSAAASGNRQRHVLSRPEVEAYIGQALDKLGITDPVARANWTKGYLVLIERESGNNVNAINLTDSNARAGIPSQGLTQTIPGTFASYHVAGTSNSITDPTANIAASMNYVMQRWKVSRDGSNLTANVQQADAGRSPMGY
ncbi:transglycosylase SLT domain-containing protein [Nocardia sp. NPDC049149]|uniref:transglycosylase SLT domain-containing protein n=1 Tax=Nocardia sp. NPDC049149 TaxID=3364315 RepID=UPI003719177C